MYPEDYEDIQDKSFEEVPPTEEEIGDILTSLVAKGLIDIVCLEDGEIGFQANDFGQKVAEEIQRREMEDE